jgi:hypothetical protein
VMVRRWRPTLAARERLAALWIEEDVVTSRSELWLRSADASALAWDAARRVDDAGVACDGVTFPSDDYMGAVPEAPFGGGGGGTASRFVIAWAPFTSCGDPTPRRVHFKTVF